MSTSTNGSERSAARRPRSGDPPVATSSGQYSDVRLHFISGLPRSGSTLLSALLRQNPRFHASVQSPLQGAFIAARESLSTHESAMFVTEQQRQAVLLAMFRAFYAHLSPGSVAFDSGRSWCALLPSLVQLLPTSRLICCVRNPAWILDSMERLFRRSPLLVPRVVQTDLGNVYTRAEAMMAANQFVGFCLGAAHEAMFGGDSPDRLVVISYDSLVARPKYVMASLYDWLNEPRFDHDFDHVAYDEPHFDAFLRVPGMHRVTGPVKPTKRSTILPPDLFRKYDTEFWKARRTGTAPVVL